MDFRIRVFLSVANNLSFTKAARELHISQPAVTKHIKELEKQFNMAMFERRGNRISLTSAGEIMYRYAQKYSRLSSSLEYEINLLQNETKGSLYIGASSTVSQYIIPKVLAAFHNRFPKVKLVLLNGNAFEVEQMLYEEKIELGIVENHSSRGDLYYTNYLEDKLVVVTGSNSLIARNNEMSFAELQRTPIVIRERGSGTLEVIENALEEKGKTLNDLNIFLHLGTHEGIKNFLPYFEGIGIVPLRAIEKDLKLNILKTINVPDFQVKRNLRIVQHKGYGSELSNKFIDFMKNYHIE